MNEDPTLIKLHDSLVVDARTQVVRAERKGDLTLITLTDGSVHRIIDARGQLWEAFKNVAIKP
jgi:hypothetical protein